MDMKEIMRSKKWGIFNHYICTPGRDAKYGVDLSDWNRTINSFDVEKLAKTLYEMGAGYYFITIIHGTEYMICPNKTYEQILGAPQMAVCPERDLIEDLYTALKKYDIDLCLYFNCLSPFNNGFSKKYREKFGIDFEHFQKIKQYDVLKEYGGEGFISKWVTVLDEIAARYGDKIKMWWLDSCYDYAGYTDEQISRYCNVIKKSNPNALIGISRWGIIHEDVGLVKAPNEDFTSGECRDFDHIKDYVPAQGSIDGALTHMLIPLGKEIMGYGRWGSPGSDHSREYVQNYIKKINDIGGIITIDIFIAPDGSFDPVQVDILKK